MLIKCVFCTFMRYLLGYVLGMCIIKQQKYPRSNSAVIGLDKFTSSLALTLTDMLNFNSSTKHFIDVKRF